jgi:hypothetical protein
MDISIIGKQLVAEVNNTSPIDLIGGTDGGNSPGITGFGFNLNPASLVLQSWKLTAYDSNSNLVTIGSSGPGTYDWVMGTTLASIEVDYLPNNGGSPDGAIFNPLSLKDPNSTLPGGINDIYFTTAILTMDFDGTPELAEGKWSPFVRMQIVGLDGEGSLKLPPSVPEPSTMLLLGAGLIGLAGFGRRIRKR